MGVRNFRAGAGHFFINREEQTDFGHAGGAQLFRSRDLRSNNTFGIARAAAIDKFFVFARSDVGRHGVHVRREHDARRRSGRGDDVCPIIRHFLQLNLVAETA